MDKYIEEVKKIWPYEKFMFKEELALHYLSLKNYDIIRALFSIIYNVDELHFIYMSK